jgi:hypothetical protein
MSMSQPGLPDGLFSNQLWCILEGLWMGNYDIFMTIWYTLWPSAFLWQFGKIFGLLCSTLSAFWYFVSIKIWRPWSHPKNFLWESCQIEWKASRALKATFEDFYQLLCLAAPPYKMHHLMKKKFWPHLNEGRVTWWVFVKIAQDVHTYLHLLHKMPKNIHTMGDQSSHPT